MRKISKTQCYLTVLYVVALLVSNIIASRQILLPFNIIQSSAVIVFPITYILSDVFSEVYGYEWSRKTCWLAFGMNLFMVIVFQIAINCPFPQGFEMAEEYKTVLGNTFIALFASLSAYVCGDWLNDIVFRTLKYKQGNTIKGFGLRAIISSVAGEIVDSSIFYTIMFITILPVNTVVQMVFIQVLIKIIYEIIILPVTQFIAKKLTEAENK